MPNQRERAGQAIERVWQWLLVLFLVLLGFAVLLALRAPDVEAFRNRLLTIASGAITLVYFFLFLRSRKR
jgi:hypothetical protein